MLVDGCRIIHGIRPTQSPGELGRALQWTDYAHVAFIEARGSWYVALQVLPLMSGSLRVVLVDER